MFKKNYKKKEKNKMSYLTLIVCFNKQSHIRSVEKKGVSMFENKKDMNFILK